MKTFAAILLHKLFSVFITVALGNRAGFLIERLIDLVQFESRRKWNLTIFVWWKRFFLGRKFASGILWIWVIIRSWLNHLWLFFSNSTPFPLSYQIFSCFDAIFFHIALIIPCFIVFLSCFNTHFLVFSQHSTQDLIIFVRFRRSLLQKKCNFDSISI